MEDLLRSHLKKSSTDLYIQENDTYGQHLQSKNLSSHSEPSSVPRSDRRKSNAFHAKT